MSINFRRFDYKSELSIQRKLFLECFPEHRESSMLSNEHYLWKFHSKPGSLKSAEFVATNEHNDLLGYYAAIPYQYRVGNTIANAAMVCDVMTGIKARGKGVFTKLGIYSTDELKKAEFDFSTGYPIRKEVIPGHLKAGWSINHELPLYARFIKCDSVLKNKKIGFLAPFINAIYNFCIVIFELVFHFSKKDIKVETYTSKQIDEIDGLDAFYQSWGSKINISLIKNVDFLKWRLGAPAKQYKILVARKKDIIIGVLIAAKIMKEAVPCIAIVDLAMSDGYHQQANLLTNKLIQIGKEDRSELVLLMIGKKWYSKYRLFTNTFIKTPFKFFLIVKKLNDRIDSKILDDEDNWHLTWIDSDDL